MGATEYSIFLSASFIVAILTFVMGLLTIRLTSKGARSFGVMMFAISLWCLGIGAQMRSTSELQSLRWIFVQMLGVILVPPFWFLFTIFFTGREDELRWWHYVLIFINSVVVYVLLLTPSLRFLLVEELIYLQYEEFIVNADWVLGQYFFVHLGFTFITIFLGDFVLLRHVLQWPKESRKKMAPVIIVTLFPILTNLALVFNFFPNIHGNLDVFGFAVTGLVLGVVLYLDRILEIQPVAEKQLMEELPDALFVFDAERRLIQSNPAAKFLLGDRLEEYTLRYLKPLLKDMDVSIQHPLRKELFLSLEGKPDSHFDVHISSLMARGRIVGYSMLLRDVSPLIESMEKLEQLATTDSLTGLFNRRYFQAEGERILEESIRYQHPMCVMTFDIDFFKRINDSYGHSVGDKVLMNVADQIRAITRKTDIVARFGGDEFVLILPETTAEFALNLTKRLQDRFKHEPLKINGNEIWITASYGLAAFLPEVDQSNPSLDELFRRADMKLYEAKEKGRNQIVL